MHESGENICLTSAGTDLSIMETLYYISWQYSIKQGTE